MNQEPECGEYRADQHSGGVSAGEQAVFLLRNEALASALPPIVAVDERGRIVFASDGVRQSLGWDPGELPGKPVSVLLPGDPDE
ncbi:MAG: PAS domain-containing protein, partial [Phycisphaerales bacterium]